MVDRSLTLGTLFTANVQQFITKIDLMKRKVGQLNATMASVGKQTRGLATATGAVDKMDKSMTKATRSGKGFSAQLGLMGGALRTVGSAAKTTASFFAAGLAIGAITKGLAAGTTEIIDFDQALKNLQAITKSTDAEVAGMGEVIKRVATETKFSTGEVAEGMVLLGQAGFSVTEAMQSMASVANLATGTLSNMRLTSDLLTTTIRAFGLSTVESARVADVMANAINRSKLTIDKLRIAFNFVGAASAQAGLSLEETAGSMMVLANHGLRASTIGTGLRQVMSRLLAPNRKLREEFKEQGIALERVNPATQGWSNALQNLLPVLIDTKTGMVNMAKAYQLFGLRGAQAAAILAKAVASGNYEKMIEFTMEVGSSARMAETQMEGLGVKLKNLADRMKLVAVAIGEAGLTDALKVLIDTLRATAKAVTDFLTSETGQVVAAFAGWTLAVWGVTKALRILITTIGIARAAIGVRFAAGLASVSAASGAASAGILGTALAITKMIGGFAKVGIIVGAALTIFRYLTSSIERQIKSLEKYDTKTQTVVQTLGLYSAKMEELIEKKEKDEDVTKEHSKLIERFQQALKELEKDYGELGIALDDNTDSMENNLEAMKNLQRAELEKTVMTNIQLIKDYNDQIDRTNLLMAIQNRAYEGAVNVWRGAWIVLNDIGNAIINVVVKGFNIWIKRLKDMAPAFSSVLKGINWIGEKFTQFWDSQAKKIDSFVSHYTGKSKEVESLTEGQRSAFVRAAQGLDALGKGVTSIEDIIEELETLSNIKMDTKTIDAINAALKKVSITLDDQKEKWKDTFDGLPEVFKTAYEKLDIIGKTEFDTFIQRLAKKEAAFESTARKMGRSEAEIYAGLAHIRVKEYQGHVEMQNKKTKITKETLDLTLAMIDYQIQYAKEAGEKRYENAKAWFIREYDEEVKTKKQLLKIEAQFLEEVSKARGERDTRIDVMAKEKQKVLLDYERQTIKEIKELNAKMYKDLQEQLKGRLKSAKKELEALQGDLLDSEKSFRDDMRDLAQLTLTDEQKWNSDREELNYQLNKARETGDREYINTAKNLAKGLAREVKNQNGETIRSIESTQREAMDRLREVQEADRALFRTAISEKKREINALNNDLDSVRNRLKTVQEEIGQLNATELALQMDQTLEDLKNAYGSVSSFREEWDALKDKSITLTVHYKHIGQKAPKSKSDEFEEDVDEAAADTETQKWGGLIRRKLGGAIRNAFDVGGKLRGYGGGDKVRALLEPGEYVVRKEAVKKYGEGVFSALNNMRVASQDAGADVAQKIGGIIKKATYRPMPVQAFASGGAVASVSSFEPPRAINVYLQPKFLTGDRRSMRVAAAEIQRALTDLDSRWGKR